MNDFLNVDGKIFLVTGFANRKSIAWFVAETLKNLGAEIIFSVRSQKRMEELKKITRVLGKKLEGSPHERIIVLDGATGQNAHSQVAEFSKAVDISGLIITKLDGSAKGGIVVSLADKFTIPIHYVGVGESLEDLDQFDAQEYSRAIVGLEKN